MQSKLQELTEKIYQEGVEKGNVEAQQIIDNAKAEASALLDKAKKEAGAIVEDAKKKAAETKSNADSEIRMAGRQSINALKQEIVDMVNGAITSLAVKSSFDKAFVKKIIDTTLANWAKSGQAMDLNILLPKEDEKDLSEYFKKEAKAFLDQGITLQFDEQIKTGFQLGPADGSYKVSFTDEDFINFFKQYLRPRLVEILFAAE